MSNRAWCAAAVAAILLAAGCGGGGGGGGPAAAGTPDPGAPATPGAPGAPAPGGPASVCVPTTCAALGKSCGVVDDGCGGSLLCGSCPSGQVCGAGGANVCGAPPATCTPTTCAAAGATCGPIPDGCGGSLACGTCAGGATCGGGGTPNVCGAPPVRGGDTRWVEYVAGGGEEGVWGVRADGAGELAVVIRNGTYPRQSLTVRKLAADRSVRWEKALAVDAGSVEPARLAVSPAGSVFVAVNLGCASFPCTGNDLGGQPLRSGVVKFAANGAFEWQKPFDGWSWGALAVARDGKVALPSEAWTTGKSFVVHDPGGNELWSARLGDAAAQQLAFAPDGSLYVSWYDYPTVSNRLARFDAAGRRLWDVETRSWLTGLATSGRGTPVALGADELAVYEPNDGAVRFRRTLPLYARDLDVQPGLHDVIRVAVTGQETAGCGHLAVRTYDLAGAFRWTRTIGPLEGCAGSPEGFGVAVLDGGEVVVGGAMRLPADLGAGPREVEDLADGFLLGLAP
jgi:hypothetical protein